MLQLQPGRRVQHIPQQRVPGHDIPIGEELLATARQKRNYHPSFMLLKRLQVHTSRYFNLLNLLKRLQNAGDLLTASVKRNL